MATIYVDEKPYRVDEKQNLLHACLTLGFDVPYFCWHPALGSVGACRQCAVKQFRNADDKHGRLVMACMTPADDGARISIHDADALAFRAGIIEGMMQNHPHDCPVCDEGGECHLQDMTVMTGHDYRRYDFRKRTFRNQYLGPFVHHEMNRCIQCYRCVRFYREYAGGNDFNVFGIRNIAFFGRYEDGVLESEFAGNLDEVCPTGVFTDATHKRHYTRKWDLQFAPSVCVHCGLGCNISPGERYGTLRRIVNRYHGDINGYFLCDRGRYGYEFVNSEQRIRGSRIKRDIQPAAISKEEALKQFAEALAAGPVIGIGSPRASLEANFALRMAVGRENFFAGISREELRLLNLVLEILRTTPAEIASLRDVEEADAVFVLGEDVASYAPRMALSLRQSVRQEPMQATDKLKIPRWLDHAVREAAQDAKGPLFIATLASTRLDEIATRAYSAVPDDLARLGYAVAHFLDEVSPAVSGLSPEMAALAKPIAGALRRAKLPLVVCGTGCRSEAVLKAGANIAQALCRNRLSARIALTVPECNSLGLALLGARPLEEGFATVRPETTAIILENDLYRRAPSGEVDAFFGRVARLVALDQLRNPTTNVAGLVLPAGTFAESDGTLINNECRAQRFFQVFVPEGDIQESWRWLRDVMIAAGRHEFAAWKSLDDVIASMGQEIPELARIAEAAPSSAFRMADEKIPRQPHRYSGRTAMHANVNVSEPKPPDDPDSALSYSMEGNPDEPPASLIPFAWSPGWNSYQAWNKFQEEIAGPLRGGNPGIRLMPANALGAKSYFNGVPHPFRSRDHEWLIVPLYHVFGTEELSLHSPGIRQLSPKAYVAINADEAARLKVQVKDTVEFEIQGVSFRAPIVIRPELPLGVAGIPIGIEPFYGVQLPAWSRITRAS